MSAIKEFNDIIAWVRDWVYHGEPIPEKEKDHAVSIVTDTVELFKPELISYVKRFKQRMFEQAFQLVEVAMPAIETMEERDETFEKSRLSIDVPPDYAWLRDAYTRLETLPQPVQRSPEWYALRNNMITASACASAMGEEKYKGIRDTLLDKLGLSKKFAENKFVYHGKKYEKIATMIYENIYNTKLGEFGLIPHPNIPFIGASPDGICMGLTLDALSPEAKQKFSNRIGRMLEIKCPLTRKIQTSGPIDDGICPHYYHVQVQVQLECCGLEECDFWQCDLREVDTEEAWRAPVKSRHTEEQDKEIQIDERLKRGILLEFTPKDTSIVPAGDEVRWYSKYIYPPSVLMTPDEYMDWANKVLPNVDVLYPDIYENYTFSRIVYWYLNMSHNVLIKRDKEWFASALPKLQMFWDRVTYYKDHLDEAQIDLIDNKPSNLALLTGPMPRYPPPEQKVVARNAKGQPIMAPTETKGKWTLDDD